MSDYDVHIALKSNHIISTKTKSTEKRNTKHRGKTNEKKNPFEQFRTSELNYRVYVHPRIYTLKLAHDQANRAHILCKQFNFIR